MSMHERDMIFGKSIIIGKVGISTKAQSSQAKSVWPKSGVNCVIFVQTCPQIDICFQNLCSSRSNFTKVASAFQRFQPVNSTQYLLGLLRNEGRVD